MWHDGPVSQACLTIGTEGGPGVTFGPLRVLDSDRGRDGSYDFIDSPIRILAEDGREWSLTGRNGMEPRALAVFLLGYCKGCGAPTSSFYSR
jgi:hypothetical protein